MDSSWTDTYQVVVGYGIAQKFSNGIASFNKQLEVLVPKPGRAITNPTGTNKTDVPVEHLCH
jgi:lipoprotein-releasing system permease protein